MNHCKIVGLTLSGLLTIAIVVAVNSCQKEKPSALNAFRRAEAAYCTNDIRLAEAALTNYLKTVSDEEGRGSTEVDFEMARIITYERLFLIYRRLNDTNSMRLCFEGAMEHLTRYNKKGRSTPAYEYLRISEPQYRKI